MRLAPRASPGSAPRQPQWPCSPSPAASPGYGFTAITVAFLGRLNPIGILVASLVVALTFIGGESAQILLKLPLDLTQAFQGILLMCVLAADAMVSYRIRFATRGGGK